MGRRYEHFLFDWDGTLAKTVKMWLDAYGATYEMFGLSPTHEQIARRFGDIRGHLALGVNESDHEIFLNALKSKVLENIGAVELYPYASELLEELQQSASVALVTTAPRLPVDAALSNLDLQRFFNAVVTFDDVERQKPHPDPIYAALNQLGGAKDRAIMIGDSDKDLAAANRAGIDSMLIVHADYDGGHRDMNELRAYEPTYECTSLEDAARILTSGLSIETGSGLSLSRNFDDGTLL